MRLTTTLTDGLRAALAKAGLPALDECVWEIPRQAEHGDYATNAAMVLARTAKRAPRQIADLIVENFPALAEVARVEVAGPGFLNVFLSPAWCAGALREILAAGSAYGRAESHAGGRLPPGVVSGQPAGAPGLPHARSAAGGASLARPLPLPCGPVH